MRPIASAFASSVILPRPDLPAEVPVDQRDRAVERLLADVGHDDVIARQRADMRDAVAHLARTDDADRLDLHTVLSLPLARAQ
jgi:hypothetical protein